LQKLLLGIIQSQQFQDR